MLHMQMSQKSRQLLLRVQALEDEQLRCLRGHSSRELSRGLHSRLRSGDSFAFANAGRLRCIATRLSRLRCIATRLSRLSFPLVLRLLPIVEPSTVAHKLSNLELWLAGCMPRQRVHAQNLSVVLSEDREASHLRLGSPCILTAKELC
jgi:hypothetical protein